ncbi:hypothetical protein AB4212_51740, partial [Streptomyces sp. 2MCAF27]
RTARSRRTAACAPAPAPAPVATGFDVMSPANHYASRPPSLSRPLSRVVGQVGFPCDDRA